MARTVYGRPRTTRVSSGTLRATRLGVPWSPDRRLLLALSLPTALVCTACNDPDAVPQPGGSTGTEGESTAAVEDGTVSISGPADGTATSSTGSPETTTGDEDSSESGDTTEGAQSGGGRFISFAYWFDEPGGELLLHSYEDDVLATPQPLIPTLLAGTDLSNVGVVDDGRGVTYCLHDGPTSECFVVDVSSETPAAAQSFEARMYIQAYLPESQTFLLWVRDEAEGAPPEHEEIYAATYQDGVLSAPQRVLAYDEAQPFDAYDLHPSSEGDLLAFTRVPDEGPGEAYLASIVGPDAESITMVSAVADPERRTMNPRVAPGGQAMTYVEAPLLAASLTDELYFVDLSGPTPAAPIRIDETVVDQPLLLGPLFSPDGSALVYWRGAGGLGDLYFVDLSGGVPSPPVVVHSEAPDQVWREGMQWSADGRWLAYVAHTAEPGSAVYLAERSGLGLSAPISIADDSPVFQESPWFDPESTWLYFRDDGELHRANVWGVGPGLAQRVSDAAPPFVLHVFPTRDPGTLMYSTSDPERGRGIHVVDIDGRRPGGAQRLDASVPRGWSISPSLEPAWDASFAVYQECSPETDGCADVHAGTRNLVLADRMSGEVHLVSETSYAALALAPAR